MTDAGLSELKERVNARRVEVIPFPSFEMKSEVGSLLSFSLCGEARSEVVDDVRG